MWHGEVIAAKSIDVGRSPAAREAFISEAMRLHQLRHAHMVALCERWRWLCRAVCLSAQCGVTCFEFCAKLQVCKPVLEAMDCILAGVP